MGRVATGREMLGGGNGGGGDEEEGNRVGETGRRAIGRRCRGGQWGGGDGEGGNGEEEMERRATWREETLLTRATPGTPASNQ